MALLPARAAWSAYLLWHVRGQARAPFRPWAAVERDQARRVRHMVTYGARHVPHYREALGRLGLTAGDVRTAVDLARFPLVGREDLQRDPERFMSAAVPRRRLVELRSGGSTGAPRSVYHDHAALFRNAAHSERDRSIRSRLLGRRTGYRQTLIASNFSGIRKVQVFLDDRGLFPQRTRVERQYLSLADPPRDNLARINAFRPDVLHTYGSYLGCLFAFAHDRRAVPPPPRDHLRRRRAQSAARSLIERQFGIPVFSIYQSIEALRIGFECEAHQGLHLNVDLYPVRIVDPEGRTLPPGTSGEVVVSNLVNHGMVLLNYRLGDVAAQLPGFLFLRALASAPCAAARTHGRPHCAPVGHGHPSAGDPRPVQRRTRDLAIPGSPGSSRPLPDRPRHPPRRRPSGHTGAGLRQFAARFGTGVAADVRFVDEVSRTARARSGPSSRSWAARVGGESVAMRFGLARARLQLLGARLATPLGRRRLLGTALYGAWPVLGPLAAASRRTALRRTHVVCVVGSFGKTTAARAVAAALGLRDPTGFGNARGLVATTLLAVPPGRSAVLEIGIGQAGDMARYPPVLRPDIAVVTGIGTEHNRSLRSLEATRHEKADMVRALGGTGGPS